MSTYLLTAVPGTLRESKRKEVGFKRQRREGKAFHAEGPAQQRLRGEAPMVWKRDKWFSLAGPGTHEKMRWRQGGQGV